MRNIKRFAVVAALAVVALAMMVGSASASRALRTTTGALTLTSTRVTFTAIGIGITCEVTLRGEITREQVEKTEAGRAIIGRVTGGSTANCRETFGGATTAEVLANASGREWQKRYDGFGGTLPSITSTTLTTLRATFRINAANLGRCTYIAREAAARASERGGRQEFDQASFERVRAENAPENPGECVEGTMSGTFTISPRIRVTLVA